MRPTHQRDEVVQRLWEVSLVSVSLDVDVPIALTEFLLLLVLEKADVHPDRRFPAESLVELHVLGGGRHPFRGSDNVRDIHEVVVDDVGEVVCGHPVGLEKDGVGVGTFVVVDAVGAVLDRTMDLVDEERVVVGSLCGQSLLATN